MAVDTKTLQSFFNKQKKPKIDALIHLNRSKKHKKPYNNLSSTKVAPNNHQSSTKEISNKHQSGIITNSKWYQSGNKTDIKTNSKLPPKWHQSDIITGFFSLTGLQKKICIIIYKLCQISRDKKTDAVSIAQLSNQCKSTVGAVKIAIRRLINKGILLRENFKNGRGGWSVYSIPNNTYQEILTLETQGKVVSNWYQTNTKLVTELVPKAPSSSSVFYINKETTTTDDPTNSKILSLPPEWENVDIEPLASLIGFTKNHLLQITTKTKLNPQQVQDSIYSLAFDLQEHNKAEKIKGDPINYFMGILCAGRIYTFASNYESPQDKSIRLYVENKRKIEQRREEIEKEAITLAFNEWFTELSNEQKKEFLPGMFRKTSQIENNKILETSARKHFEVEIWPSKKNKITQINKTTQTNETTQTTNKIITIEPEEVMTTNPIEKITTESEEVITTEKTEEQE